jgi:hypothetical protein
VASRLAAMKQSLGVSTEALPRQGTD